MPVDISKLISPPIPIRSEEMEMGIIPPPKPKNPVPTSVSRKIEEVIDARIAELEAKINELAANAANRTTEQMEKYESDIERESSWMEIEDIPEPPTPPPARVIREGLDVSPFPCPRCGSSQKLNWKLKTVGCFQPRCENYYITNKEKIKKEKEEIKTVDKLPKNKYDLD